MWHTNCAYGATRSALFERVRKCALEDQRRMEGFLEIFHGARACGCAYIRNLEHVRDSMCIPAPYMLTSDLVKIHEIWWGLSAAVNCMMTLDFQESYAKLHAIRMRQEYAAMFMDLAATENVEALEESMKEGSYQAPPVITTQDDETRASTRARDQTRLQVISDVISVKEREQATWKPNGLDMDWGNALLGSSVVIFPRTIGEILPIWPHIPGQAANDPNHQPALT